jgi:two-component system, NtrC family, sensor histidine kinase PilS
MLMTGAMGRTERMLRWLYSGRLIVASAIFVAALARWLGDDTQLATLIATVALLSALAVTTGGVWWTEFRGRAPGRVFLYAQLTFDVLLVTAIVHVTGGSASPYPPLYILVITAAALLLPLSGGLVICALASLLYISGLVLSPTEQPIREDFLRVGLFFVVAGATAVVADRLRRTGAALGEAETELRQLRLDTNDIMGTIDTSVVTVDGAGRLIYMNAAAADLLGLSLPEWSGRAVLDHLDLHAPGLGTLLRRTAATRVGVTRFEIRKRTVAGVRYLGVRTTVLDRQGMPWVTAVIQDVTDGKQIEELIRRAERLQAVAELGASLAHEIKNPLASVRSAVEQLAGDRLQRADRDMLRNLVVTESDRLSRLLSEFMEFSRVEVRRTAVVDLGTVTSQVVELVQRHPERDAGTSIDYRRPAGAIAVGGDPDLLHRAVFNLVLNAVQHAGPGGTVAVQLDRPETLPPGVELDGAVRIEVRDSGPGVREEDIPRMFDPFFTRRNGGTGLGLAMVHRAVEVHRGAILVDRAPEGGARFTIYLPAHAGGELTDGLPAA